ncbi:MAG: hypothetical protein ACYDHH_04185 [Solirubrobacteraceae bacterium]
MRVQVLDRHHGWPGYMDWDSFLSAFEPVRTGAEVVILQVLDWDLRSSDADLSPSLRALDQGVPTVVFDNRDHGEVRSDWDLRAAELIARASLVVGPNLPRELGDRGLGMLCGGLAHKRALSTPYAGSGAPVELSFVGAFEAPEPGTVPDVRSLEARGLALQTLEAGLKGRRLMFCHGDYWAALASGGPVTPAQLRDMYGNVMADSAMVFSPVGRGYQCMRHTEVWQHRRLMLMTRLDQRILVPEPELWEQRALGVDYAWDGSDLLVAAQWALDRLDDLNDRVAEGHEYYRRWGSGRARRAQIARAFGRLAS